jgi:hypothetical protein
MFRWLMGLVNFLVFSWLAFWLLYPLVEQREMLVSVLVQRPLVL